MNIVAIVLTAVTVSVSTLFLFPSASFAAGKEITCTDLKIVIPGKQQLSGAEKFRLRVDFTGSFKKSLTLAERSASMKCYRTKPGYKAEDRAFFIKIPYSETMKSKGGSLFIFELCATGARYKVEKKGGNPVVISPRKKSTQVTAVKDGVC